MIYKWGHWDKLNCLHLEYRAFIHMISITHKLHMWGVTDCATCAQTWTCKVAWKKLATFFEACYEPVTLTYDCLNCFFTTFLMHVWICRCTAFVHTQTNLGGYYEICLLIINIVCFFLSDVRRILYTQIIHTKNFLETLNRNSNVHFNSFLLQLFKMYFLFISS